MATAAIIYKKDGYNTSGQRLLGRQAASEGFLKALVKYSTSNCFYCYTDTQAEFTEFCQRIQPWIPGQKQARWISTANIENLADPGILYRPDPLIADLTWQRRYFNQRAYSICGITHTVASKEVTKSIGDLLLAPMQPWDAVICTSFAVKTILEKTLDNWADYLTERLNARPKTKLNFPVIPLGIDCDFFPQGDKKEQLRNQLRLELKIEPQDIVVLFVGRLIFHAKAHPVPMYMALERAAVSTKTKIHLIQAGWFEDQEQEFSFKSTASLYSPNVKTIFLDGRDSAIRQNIWAAADIFISLADNIQETFGLTPVEAMAAGLPVIVSDWNGYKETVRHEVDGFRIPTLLAPDKSALDISAGYFDDSLNYSTYIGYLSMMTSVDVEACSQALISLIHDPQLRQKMGENGRKRARKIYDWQVIIKEYENLWQELNQLRKKALAIAPVKNNAPAYPLIDDPTRLYSHYPSQILNQQHKLKLGSLGTPEQLDILMKVKFTGFGSSKRASKTIIDQILAAIATEGSLSVEELIKRYANETTSKIYLYRTLMYLLKFDVLRLEK